MLSKIHITNNSFQTNILVLEKLLIFIIKICLSKKDSLLINMSFDASSIVVVVLRRAFHPWQSGMSRYIPVIAFYLHTQRW